MSASPIIVNVNGTPHTSVGVGNSQLSEIIRQGKCFIYKHMFPRHGRTESTHRPPKAELITGRKHGRAHTLSLFCPFKSALIVRHRTRPCVVYTTCAESCVRNGARSYRAPLGTERSEPCANAARVRFSDAAAAAAVHRLIRMPCASTMHRVFFAFRRRKSNATFPE